MAKEIKLLNIGIITVIVLLVINLVILYRQPANDYNKIDSLSTKIDSLSLVRDSIVRQVDTIAVKLKENDKNYYKTFYIIANNTVTDDYIFFRKYLADNKARLDSISDSIRIKGN